MTKANNRFHYNHQLGFWGEVEQFFEELLAQQDLTETTLPDGKHAHPISAKAATHAIKRMVSQHGRSHGTSAAIHGAAAAIGGAVFGPAGAAGALTATSVGHLFAHGTETMAKPRNHYGGHIGAIDHWALSAARDFSHHVSKIQKKEIENHPDPHYRKNAMTMDEIRDHKNREAKKAFEKRTGKPSRRTRHGSITHDSWWN